MKKFLEKKWRRGHVIIFLFEGPKFKYIKVVEDNYIYMERGPIHITSLKKKKKKKRKKRHISFGHGSKNGSHGR